MAHLFLSYAHADKARVFPLHAELETVSGHYIWIDKEELVGGIEWERAIRLGIQESYGVLLAVTSTFFTRPFILEKEIPWALEHFREALERGERRVFVLLLDAIAPGDLDGQARAVYDAVFRYQAIDAIDADWPRVARELVPLLPEPVTAGHNFIVNWPRLTTFQGRGGLLKELHERMKRGTTRPTPHISLYGLGGVGKTQLAVEYAHRYRFHYPAGVYWINGARNWKQEIEAVADRLRLTPADANAPDRAGQMAVAFSDHLRKSGGDALIVVDNVEHPADVQRTEIGPAALRLPDLPARLLITTRRAELPTGFAGLSVATLEHEPEAARAMLHDARPEENDTALLDEICRALGYLPLTLGMAAAALRKRKEMSLAAFLKHVQQKGIDEVARAVRVNKSEAALGSVLDWHWEQLQSEDAKHIMALTAAFGEAEVVPLARLRILAGMPDDPDALEQPFDDAAQELRAANLVEAMGEHAIRLHPLVREYVQRIVPDHRRQLAEGLWMLAQAYNAPDSLQREAQARGFNALLGDLRSVRQLFGANSGNANDVPALLPIAQLERLFNWEAHLLRGWPAGSAGRGDEGHLIQHLRERAHHQQSYGPLVNDFDRWLARHAPHHFRTAANWHLPYDSALVRVFEGHAGYINAVLLTPNGRFAISAADDNTLRLWSMQGETLRTFKGHTDLVSAVALSADGRRALSASYDGTLRLWNTDTGAQVAQLAGDLYRTQAVALSPDGARAASAGFDNTIRIWDVSNGALIDEIKGHGGVIYSLCFSSDCQRLLSAGADRTVRLWDVAHGTELKRFQGHAAAIHTAIFSPDERRVYSGSADSTIRIWDVANGVALGKLEGHTARVSGLAVSANDRLLSGGYDNTIRLWDLNTGRPLQIIRAHGRAVHSVALSREGDQALSGSADRTIRLWDLAEVAGQIDGQAIDRHSAAVNTIAATADGQRILSGSDDYTLRLWDTSTAQPTKRVMQRERKVRACALTADERGILTGGDDNMLVLWDTENGAPIQRFAGHTRRIKAVAATPNGRYALTAGYDLTLRVWFLVTGEQIHELKGHSADVRAICVTRDSHHALTGSADQTLRLWDIVDGKGLTVFRGHTSIINGLALTPDDRLAVSVSRDLTVRVWDMATGMELRRMTGHESRVNAVAVSADSRFAVTASSDKTLRLWELATGASLAVLHIETAPTCLCRVPGDGFRVAVGDVGGGVRVIQIVTPT